MNGGLYGRAPLFWFRQGRWTAKELSTLSICWHQVPAERRFGDVSRPSGRPLWASFCRDSALLTNFQLFNERRVLCGAQNDRLRRQT